MDDPWGSPWDSANPDNATKNDPKPPPPESFLLSPPPRALLSSNTNSPAHSPWVDYNGSGEWTCPTPMDEGATPAPWGLLPESTLAPQADSPGKQSPPAWPSSAATSPALKPTIRSRASSFLHQPSPDPWAGESPWSDKHEVLSSISDLLEPKHGAEPDAVTHVQKPNAAAESFGYNEELASVQDFTIEAKGTPVSSSPKFPMNPTTEKDGQDNLSRPSSTFSMESNHGLDRQDSPITSIDEESTSCPGAPARKISRKVSELVGLFDGLSHAISEEPPAPAMQEHRELTRDGSTIRTMPEDHTNEASLGDGEGSIDERSETSECSDTSFSSNRSSTPKVMAVDEDKQRQSVDGDGYSKRTFTASATIQEVIDKFGIIEFLPNTELLEQLFDKVPEMNDVVEHANDDLQDHIITDTFSSVEERRAWYRISRYGSMRKHNSGDEENYHRVNWQTSQLRIDIIKVVRRWMEEDSFSGKPTIGGSKRTSGFNWDSSAAPIGLDKVFARRSLASTPKSGSVAKFGHTPASSIGSLASVLEEHKLSQLPFQSSIPSASPSVSASPIPSFGWSSIAPLATSNPGGSVSEIAAAQTSTQTTTIPKPISDSSQTLSIERPDRGDHNRHDKSNDDTEDDWDEMVFSPVSGSFTAPDSQIGHQKSNSATEESTSKPENTLLIHESSPAANSSSVDLTTSFAGTSTLFSHTTVPSSGSDTSRSSMKAGVDPWASVDLSNFDVTVPTSKRTTTLQQSTAKLSPPPQPRDSVSYTLQASQQSSGPGIALGPIEISNVAAENDAVKEILQSLPDFTYMLR